jgi:hypothetical protein
VPFEVTGDGPTISLGLTSWFAGDRPPPSTEVGWRVEESAELRAELSSGETCEYARKN